MSAQRSVPSTGPPRAALIAGLALAAAVTGGLGYVAGFRAGATHDILVVKAADAQRVAFVRESRCGADTCQTLWIGNAHEDAVQVAALDARTERCEDVAMARDGFRLGFLVNGYDFRVFDAETRKQIKQVNLIQPDHIPSSRIARGVTFSPTGAAVTFDDCPRDHSGCRSGLAAIR